MVIDTAASEPQCLRSFPRASAFAACTKVKASMRWCASMGNHRGNRGLQKPLGLPSPWAGPAFRPDDVTEVLGQRRWGDGHRSGSAMPRRSKFATAAEEWFRTVAPSRSVSSADLWSALRRSPRPDDAQRVPEDQGDLHVRPQERPSSSRAAP